MAQYFFDVLIPPMLFFFSFPWLGSLGLGLGLGLGRVTSVYDQDNKSLDVSVLMDAWDVCELGSCAFTCAQASQSLDDARRLRGRVI